MADTTQRLYTYRSCQISFVFGVYYVCTWPVYTKFFTYGRYFIVH